MTRTVTTGTGRTPERLARLLHGCKATPLESKAFRQETSRPQTAVDPARPVPPRYRPGRRHDS